MRLVSVKAPPSIPGTEREGKFNYLNYLKAQMVDVVSLFPSKFWELIIKSQISVTLVFIYLFII